MRIGTNKYSSIMSFAQKELAELYSSNEIKTLVYYLFEEYLGLDKAHYILNANNSMSESELLKFNFAIKDLKKGKPIQYILEHSHFCDLKFFVNNETLIPRQETEELVYHIIEMEKFRAKLKILDIGTGTGCIPISLALNMPQHYYYGLDFKEEIITLAQKNADHHKVDISFRTLNILETSATELGEYDIIISNPPYVLESEKNEMHINVLKHEPSSALYVSDNDALLFYRKITSLASTSLKKGGRIYLEINQTKAKETKELLESSHFKNISIHQDIHSNNRYISAEKSI